MTTRKRVSAVEDNAVQLNQAPLSAQDQAHVRSDFRNFLWYIWSCEGYSAPSENQYEIAEYMAERPDTARIIKALRGIGKSYIAACYVVWRWMTNPNLEVLVCEENQDRAKEFAGFVRKLIFGIDFLHYMKPVAGQSDSILRFDIGPKTTVSMAPSFAVLGIFGSLVGKRADLIIADDVETSKNARTAAAKARVRKAVKEFESIIKPGGQVIYLGTDHFNDSLYNELHKTYGYECRVWPSEYPRDAEHSAIRAGTLAPRIWKAWKENPELAGQPTEPRFDTKELLKRQQRIGPTEYKLQFLLDTTKADWERFPLRCGDMIVLKDLGIEKAPVGFNWTDEKAFVLKELPMVGQAGDTWRQGTDIDEMTAAYQESILVVDPAGTGGKNATVPVHRLNSGDETAYCVIKSLNGRLFLLDAGGFAGGTSDRNLTALALLAKKHKVQQVRIEANFGRQGVTIAEVKPFEFGGNPVKAGQYRAKPAV